MSAVRAYDAMFEDEAVNKIADVESKPVRSVMFGQQQQGGRTASQHAEWIKQQTSGQRLDL